ncbi:Glycosyltransferase fragment, family GT28, partial [Chondrus crispus]
MIAGGGTGGHLYPGVALAEEITTRHPDNEVLFVGTRRGLEARVIPELGFPLELIQVSGLKGTGLGKRMQGFMQLPGALWQSMQLVRRFRPDVAVGVGGYASGPAILAARLCGVPTAVLEQNTVPGVTNRILGRMVDAVYVMFDGSADYFPQGKVQRLGNPIRRQLLENFLRPPEAVEEGAPFRVLVLGGSQGAHALNLRMVEAAATLSQAQPTLHVVHQTGRKDRELVEKGYAHAGLSAEVHEFIDDVSAAYRQADLVVCRAGATTLAEVMVAKKPAILVPYPHAADNHQELNAQVYFVGQWANVGMIRSILSPVGRQWQQQRWRRVCCPAMGEC